jgi:hypothetical protein
MTEETDPAAPEGTPVDDVDEQPEPKPVGHGVVQDNVSEPGVQHTYQVDEDGSVTDTSSHGGDDEVAPEAVEEVESEDALVGAAGSAAADDGAGDDGEALTGEEE